MRWASAASRKWVGLPLRRRELARQRQLDYRAEVLSLEQFVPEPLRVQPHCLNLDPAAAGLGGQHFDRLGPVRAFEDRALGKLVQDVVQARGHITQQPLVTSGLTTSALCMATGKWKADVAPTQPGKWFPDDRTAILPSAGGASKLPDVSALAAPLW